MYCNVITSFVHTNGGIPLNECLFVLIGTEHNCFWVHEKSTSSIKSWWKTDTSSMVIRRSSIQRGRYTDCRCLHVQPDKHNIPSGSSDCSTSQYGGAQPGLQWHLLSWLQTCQGSHSQSCHVVMAHNAPKCCEINKRLTPWLLHLAEQSFGPYTFMFLMFWHRWL